MTHSHGYSQCVHSEFTSCESTKLCSLFESVSYFRKCIRLENARPEVKWLAALKRRAQDCVFSGALTTTSALSPCYSPCVASPARKSTGEASIGLGRSVHKEAHSYFSHLTKRDIGKRKKVFLVRKVPYISPNTNCMRGP